jgi:hypothetical protein
MDHGARCDICTVEGEHFYENHTQNFCLGGQGISAVHFFAVLKDRPHGNE